jgi:hypothetical protein
MLPDDGQFALIKQHRSPRLALNHHLPTPETQGMPVLALQFNCEKPN